MSNHALLSLLNNGLNAFDNLMIALERSGHRTDATVEIYHNALRDTAQEIFALALDRPRTGAAPTFDVINLTGTWGTQNESVLTVNHAPSDNFILLRDFGPLTYIGAAEADQRSVRFLATGSENAIIKGSGDGRACNLTIWYPRRPAVNDYTLSRQSYVYHPPQPGELNDY